MKNNTIFKLITVLCLLLALAMSICACDGTTPTESTAQTEAPTEAPTEAETETEEATEAETEAGLVYTVTVKNADGTPATGIYVQFCSEKTCLAPVLVNAEGVATFTVDSPDTYKAKALAAGMETEYSSFGDSTELTITLN